MQMWNLSFAYIFKPCGLEFKCNKQQKILIWELNFLASYCTWTVKYTKLCQNVSIYVNTHSYVLSARKQLGENQMCFSILDPFIRS